MKLYEKMAWDWSIERGNYGFAVEHALAMDAYEAGFKVAREMAKAMLTHSDDARFNLYGALDKLGEEDVE